MSVKALDWAFEQDLPSGPKFVLVSLADHADAGGACFPSVRRLMKRTGLSRATVSAHLAALRKSGHIRASQRRYREDGGQRSNRVWLAIPGVDPGYDPDDDDDEDPPLKTGGGSEPSEKSDFAPRPDFGPSPPNSEASPVQISDAPSPRSGPITVIRTVTTEPSDNRETRAGPNAPASPRQVAFLGELNERLGGSTTAGMLDGWQEDMTREQASAEIQEALAEERARRPRDQKGA